MDNTDKRTHTRAQYFLIKDAQEMVPVYAFRNPDDVQAIPALVVDLGNGGVQILTTHTADLSQQTYTLELVVDLPGSTRLEPAQVEKIWAREDGVNMRTGFAFSQGTDAGAKWADILQAAPHHLLRCILHPVQ